MWSLTLSAIQLAVITILYYTLTHFRTVSWCTYTVDVCKFSETWETLSSRLISYLLFPNWLNWFIILHLPVQLWFITCCTLETPWFLHPPEWHLVDSVPASSSKVRLFRMKNEVYYKQRQRAVSSHLAAVSSVQITPFDWFIESAHRRRG